MEKYMPENNGGTRIPQTIEELKAFCAEKGMPLEKMRFFIGENIQEPKAFGIYRDENDRFVVYKNKADGSRAVRYSGPDEAYAVRELYLKLKSRGGPAQEPRRRKCSPKAGNQHRHHFADRISGAAVSLLQAAQGRPAPGILSL